MSATYVWKIRIYRNSRLFTCMNTWNGIWCGCALSERRRTELNRAKPEQQQRTPVRKNQQEQMQRNDSVVRIYRGHESGGIGLKMDQNDVIPFDNHVECSFFMYNKCYRNHPRWNAISFRRGPFSIHLQWARTILLCFLAIPSILFWWLALLLWLLLRPSTLLFASTNDDSNKCERARVCVCEYVCSSIISDGQIQATLLRVKKQLKAFD